MAFVTGQLEVSDLSHAYRPSAVVGPVSLVIPPGSCLGLVGSNGAGKTTILRMVCGLTPPTTGAVLVSGRLPTRFGPQVSITGMIEEPAFYPFLGARENLRAFAGGWPQRLARIESSLERVDLAHTMVKFSEFSQGMRQRLGIARLLMARSPVIVFDEPTNGLDPVFLREFRNIIAELCEQGHSILLSSHMLHEVQQMCDQYVMMSAGRTLLAGATRDIAPGTNLEDLYFTALQDYR